MIHHIVYGLVLASDEVLPGLPIADREDRIPDVRIHIKASSSPVSCACTDAHSFYVSDLTDENGIPTLRARFLAGGDYLALTYCDGARFAIDRRGHEVFAEWPDSMALEDIAPYLLGPVLGLVLRLRGTVPLHASAVAIGDCAVAFAGPAGAGKSTTAAALAKRKCRVLSDDVVALNQDGSRLVVPSGYPRVNLWKESIQGVLGEGGTLPLISPNWDKHFMPLDEPGQFEARALELAGIYILQKREPKLEEPLVERLTGTEAFAALLSNTYMNYLPDREMRRREFELLGRVVAEIPIRCVRVPANLSKLPDLCAVIEADAKSALAERSAPFLPSNLLAGDTR